MTTATTIPTATDEDGFPVDRRFPIPNALRAAARRDGWTPQQCEAAFQTLVYFATVPDRAEV